MTFYSNQKRDYVLNPRGKALYDGESSQICIIDCISGMRNILIQLTVFISDSNRFGTKMLEKMGWSKGKGLGANLDGQLEFIKVSHKGDQKGVGFKDRDDQWTTHESNFNSLLSSFQSAENSDEEPQDCAVQHFKSDDKPAKRKKENVYEKEELFSGVSLEEQSKNSRARVHYKKFTRGKDLSRYSEKDLANIFGKKSLASNVEEDGSNNEIIETEKLDKSSEHTPNFGITTIETGTTINDYFKNKMKKATNGVNGTSSEQGSYVENLSGNKKEKKKRKKSSDNLPNGDVELKVSEEIDVAETPSEQPSISEQGSYEENRSGNKKEKKKRKKSKASDNLPTGDSELKVSEEVDVAEVPSEQPSISDSKKRNRDNDNTEETKSRKKKKSVDSSIVETLEMEANEVEASSKSKKNKKKNKSEKSTKNEDIQTEKSSKSKSETKIEKDCTTTNENPDPSKCQNGYDTSDSQSTKNKSKVEATASSEIPSNDLHNENASSEKKSKRKREKNEQEISNAEPTTSSVPQSTNLFEMAATVSVDPEVITDNVYEIRRYRTEIFRYVDLHAFPGSTLYDLPGYGYTSEMTLKIVDKQDDNRLINSMWNDAQDKYANGDVRKKKKKFVEHIDDLKKKNVFKI